MDVFLSRIYSTGSKYLENTKDQDDSKPTRLFINQDVKKFGLSHPLLWKNFV